MVDDDYYGESNEARARRRRSVITFSLVILMLFFAAWYAFSYIRADSSPATASPTTSSPTTTCDLAAKDVEVNVYNATNRAGLAAQVAKGLRERGFAVKTVANDPKRAELTGRGELRYGDKGKSAAELVDNNVGTFARNIDERTRTSVDVVLGPEFDGLVAPAAVPSC